MCVSGTCWEEPRKYPTRGWCWGQPTGKEQGRKCGRRQTRVWTRTKVKWNQNNEQKGRKKTPCVAGLKVTGIEEKKKSKGEEREEGVGWEVARPSRPEMTSQRDVTPDRASVGRCDGSARLCRSLCVWYTWLFILCTFYFHRACQVATILCAIVNVQTEFDTV
jgi:hypothetical protein